MSMIKKWWWVAIIALIVVGIVVGAVVWLTPHAPMPTAATIQTDLATNESSSAPDIVTVSGTSVSVLIQLPLPAAKAAAKARADYILRKWPAVQVVIVLDAGRDRVAAFNR